METIKRLAKELNLKAGKFLGSGMHMNQQPWTQSAKAGDYCWDGDFGYIMYTGKRWYPVEFTPQEIATNRPINANN